ncbi:tumor suppressor protein Gltscr2 [Artomyces pyxidatus]|uniref:Tumor suppressor protein Gltscr2 n=1 Tax=Artomyces pyxidatus TaxID=48021 RepID=A0ACB8SWS0_9AGAM|nr:tumor suppressor protein Gltscr2 [Artomyces pyxidatus]
MTTADKSKRKALAANSSKPPKKSAAASVVGAPAQHNQSSRKGKKAWRKNVDIEDVEEKLEGIRGEERLFGTALHAKKDEELFIIDKKGDETVRKSLPKFSRTLLSSHRILTERSAIPAVLSRPTSSRVPSSVRVTRREKDRLLRIGRKDRKGPLNSLVDHTQFGEGSALLEVSEAVRKSGQYDVWTEGAEDSPKVKVRSAPNTPHPRQHIAVPAIPAPHAGTSYNPPVSAHTELLRTAHELEERRVKEAEELEKTKARILGARAADAGDAALGGVQGMLVDKPEDSPDIEEEENDGTEVAVEKKVPQRKTKQQRRKAEKQRTEKRALAERAFRKRMLASVDSYKSMRAMSEALIAAREKTAAARQARAQERLQKGLAGHKLGKHKIREGEVDVQLGEELSESLRELKPEGNLFRDRFMSMQHRALVEPRVPVLPKKRKTRMVEYEKHAWKRFE